MKWLTVDSYALDHSRGLMNRQTLRDSENRPYCRTGSTPDDKLGIVNGEAHETASPGRRYFYATAYHKGREYIVREESRGPFTHRALSRWLNSKAVPAILDKINKETP